ncbi:MAG: hypothetical protein F6K56_08425 [Moorea sp. SIO3G5]|nr:hypothetical protein [Moorena sp. SIO3G5]
MALAFGPPYANGHATGMAKLLEVLSANLCYGKLMGFYQDFKFQTISNY